MSVNGLNTYQEKVKKKNLGVIGASSFLQDIPPAEVVITNYTLSETYDFTSTDLLVRNETFAEVYVQNTSDLTGENSDVWVAIGYSGDSIQGEEAVNIPEKRIAVVEPKQTLKIPLPVDMHLYLATPGALGSSANLILIKYL